MRRSQEECAHPTELSTKKLECGEADVVRIFRSQSKRWENNIEEGRHKLAYECASVFELILNCMFLGKDRRRQRQPTPVLLPGKSHGRRSLVGCSPWGHKESDMTEQIHIHFSLSCVGEGNGNPLQCSCLENPRDRGAWWTAVYGVAQNRTQLKRLSTSSCSRKGYHKVCQISTREELKITGELRGKYPENSHICVPTSQLGSHWN